MEEIDGKKRKDGNLWREWRKIKDIEKNEKNGNKDGK